MIVAEETETDPIQALRAGPVLRNVVETARVLGVAEMTVRRWIADGCPVERKGGHGKPYILDVRRVRAWADERDRQNKSQEAQRQAEDDALRAEYLGDESLTAKTEQTGARQVAEWLRAERDATELARMRNELIPAATVQLTIREAYSVFRDRMLSIPDHIQTVYGLDDDVVDGMIEQISDALNKAAEEIRNLEIAA